MGDFAMDNTTDNSDELLAGLIFAGLLPFILAFLLLLCWALVAGFIAQERDRSFWGFFLATFFVLGPLGVGIALLATRGEMDRLPPSEPKRKVVEGRQRFVCPRCGAESDIPNADTTYNCWRCGEHRKVKPKVIATSGSAKG
jgi:DNA-directed RNA polymerase subunit RPC12/RpoP